MPPLFSLTLALYAASCTLYFVAVAQPRLVWPQRLAVLLLLLGLLGQGADIAWLCLHGQHPGSSAREALFLASFLMLGILPVRTFRQPLPLLGALLLPVAMVIDVVVRVLPRATALALPGGEGSSAAPRFVHILSATLGIALFGVAAAASVAYMLNERRLKRRRPQRGVNLSRGPSLETLDAWNQQGIVFGLLAFTAALVSGTFWLLAAPLPGRLPAEPGLVLQAQRLLSQPRYTLAVITWLLFAGLLVGRIVLGLRGRFTAQLTLVGFWTSLGVLVIYLFRDQAGQRP
ncbi:MAG: cytochrome c biogenesis protein CcsA [Polyangia bacterium]